MSIVPASCSAHIDVAFADRFVHFETDFVALGQIKLRLFL